MAQYVGRSRFAPTVILLLLVSAYVVRLANAAGVSTSTPSTAMPTGTMTVDDIVRHGDVLPRVVQLAVNSAAVVALSALPLGANPADSRRVPLVEFLGAGLDRNLTLRWSSSNRDCSRDAGNTLDAAWTSSAGDRAIYRFRTVPDAKIIAVYFCMRNDSDEKWSNLGDRVSIKYLVRSE